LIDAIEINNKYVKKVTPIRMLSNIWRDVRSWKKKYITLSFGVYVTILICYFEIGVLISLFLVYYKYKEIISFIYELFKENEEVS